MLQTNRAYFITNKKSGTALDLSSADHVSIAGYAFHGGDNQKWVILQQESGLWAIQSIGNESFLGVAAAPGDGVRVTGTGVPTLWDIQPVEEDPGNYRIYVPCSPLNADMSGDGNPAPGTPVELRARWGLPNQVWSFQQA